jgi:proteasome lid subunit RPN8/RPN11
MSRRLTLPRRVVNALLNAAQQQPQQEVCGFVVRRNGGVALLPVSNVADTPHCRFEMDPRELLEAFRRARDDGQTLLAVYHSHPTGAAVPSALDRELAYYPELPYLVVALGTRGVLELRAYRLGPGLCDELELALDEAPS